jgi:DNA-binding NarL/FixJ family response regulator
MTLVTVNEFGFTIGEAHHRCKLTDRDVELIRVLSECGLSYRSIAEKFEISRITVGRICRYERRGQTVFGHKEVKRGT